MPNCAVVKCGSYSRKTNGTDIKYFRFPKNIDLQKQWIRACHRADQINLANARICSLHFNPSQFEVPLKHRLLNISQKNARYLKSDAVPIENLPHKKSNTAEQCTNKRILSVARIEMAERKEAIEAILHNNNQSQSTEISNRNDYCPTNFHMDEHAYANSHENCTKETKDPLDYNKICLLEKKILLLDAKISQLECENSNLKKDLVNSKRQNHDLKTKFSTYFTPGQMKRVLHPEKKTKWNAEDMSFAVTLCSISPNGYRYLLGKGFPLPAFSTMRKWTSQSREQRKDAESI